MIRFITTGSDGVVLGLGVTEGNLQLLQRDEPIVFDLAELDLPPRRFVIAVEGSAVADDLRASSAAGACFVLSLSESEIEALRSTGLARRDLASDGLGAAWALLIYGDTEVHILQAMNESGLAPAGTEVLGWEQYVRDVERKGVFGQGGVVPPEGSWVDIKRVSDSHGRSIYTRLVASPTAWLVAIVALAGLLTLVIQAVRGGDVESKPEIRRPDAPMPGGETQRKRLVDQFDPRVFAAVPGEAPCPLSVWVPEPLGPHPVASGPARASVDETARLEQAFLWMFDARLMDVAPATADGLPGLSRAIRSAPDGDGWRGAETYATLVVSELEDAVILGPVGEQDTREEALLQGTRTITTQALAVAPGRVRARLVVWDYAVDAVVCASEPVEVETPALHLSTFDSSSGQRSEDGVLKARVETLIAAARKAQGRLREVRPAR